jgi:dUTP pyrophosphatase
MTPDPIVRIQRLEPERDRDLPLPRYMTAGAAGMDIPAAIADRLTLLPNKIQLVPSGFAIALPDGFEAQIRPRSGLAVKQGITVVNAPGTIDADYRGEVKVALINLGGRPYDLKRGERMAQMVIQRVWQATLSPVHRLPPSKRAGGGFGHTGRK